MRRLSARRPPRPLAASAVVAAVSVLAGLAQPAVAAAAPAPVARPVGVDVSRWQSAGPGQTCAPTGISWSRVASTSRRFVLIRATRTKSGVTATDACFARNWAGARTAGLYRGAYHYAVPSAKAGSAAHDARAFVAVTGRLQDAGDLPPVLDLEVTGGLKPAALQAWARTWLTTVRSLTGRQPMIYTFPSFWRTAMADSTAFHAYPLWIAHWTSRPSVPGGWPTYTMQQYSATGRVAGIGGDVDLDVFNGSAAQLHAFAHPGTHPTAVTSAPTAYRGSAWTISGHLRTDAGTAVRGATVRLFRRTGTGPWTVVASARTSAVTGYYRFELRPTAAASYKVRYSGGRDLAASWSGVRSHTIHDRYATVTAATTTAPRVPVGGRVTIAGSLTRTASRLPLRRQPVVVYQRVGTGAWTVLRTLTTSTTGRYSTTVAPLRATSYKVVFAGSVPDLPSSSAVRAVTVR